MRRLRIMKGLLRQIDKYKFNSQSPLYPFYYYHLIFCHLSFQSCCPLNAILCCHSLLNWATISSNPTPWVWPSGRMNVRISRRSNILDIETTGVFVRSLNSKISQSTRKLVRTNYQNSFKKNKKKNHLFPFAPLIQFRFLLYSIFLPPPP